MTGLRPFACAIAVLSLLPLSARPSYTIDLIWSVNGLPYLNISPNDPTAANSGACAGGFRATITTGRCLEVRLTADAIFKAAVVSIGWNSASSGLRLGGTGDLSFGQFGSGPLGLGPTAPNVAGTGDCAGLVGPVSGQGCDTAHGSFGGATAGIVAPGTYTIGSINFDTSGVSVGLFDVLAFLRTGVGGVVDKQGNAAPVQLNGAVIDVSHGPPIPEPATAALLGLGLVALAVSRRAPH